MAGVVLTIYIATQKGKAMKVKPFVQVTKKGIKGDRYAKRAGAWSKPEDDHRDVTFLALEDLEQGNARREKDGLALFCPEETRRNFFTRGMDLETLVGKRFRVGAKAEFEWTGPCDPCTRPSKLAMKPGFPGYFNGGIRAKVIKPGRVYPDDEITVLN